MEIKRKTEITSETRRKFVVRSSDAEGQFFCPVCESEEQMLAAELAAQIFGVSRREIYRLVEAGAAHFVESDADVLLVCLASLEMILGNGARTADRSERRKILGS